MMCRKFELVPIKIGFFYKFLKVVQKSDQSPCTIDPLHGDVIDKLYFLSAILWDR